MKYFLTYSKKDDCVWGLGTSKRESAKDAVKELGENFASDPGDLHTVECEKELFDDIQKNCWNFQKILVSGKKAFLAPEEHKCIKEI